MKDIIKQAYKNAVNKQFYSDNPKLDVYNKLREEVDEFYCAIPSDDFNKDSEQSEISDILIVILAYCGLMGYDIEKNIQEKLDYNIDRKDHQLEIFT